MDLLSGFPLNQTEERSKQLSPKDLCLDLSVFHFCSPKRSPSLEAWRGAGRSAATTVCRSSFKLPGISAKRSVGKLSLQIVFSTSTTEVSSLLWIFRESLFGADLFYHSQRKGRGIGRLRRQCGAWTEQGDISWKSTTAKLEFCVGVARCFSLKFQCLSISFCIFATAKWLQLVLRTLFVNGFKGIQQGGRSIHAQFQGECRQLCRCANDCHGTSLSQRLAKQRSPSGETL